MAKLNKAISVIGHYKYLIVCVLGVAYIGFLSENSLTKLVKLDMRLDDLKHEVEQYNKEDDYAKRALDELKNNPEAVEKVARERYFMKKADEDVFVLSTDENGK